MQEKGGFSMVIHVVQPGDSLYRIAQLHSVPLPFLIQQNELHEPYRLTPGQTIVVPQPEKTYIVRRGDTLGSIAAQNGTNQQIMVEEQLPDANLELVTKIPDGVNMVKNGRVDALAVPKTVYDSVLAENDDLEIADFAFDFEGGNYIASVKGEDTLTAKIQEMIDTINAEGLYQQWVDEIQK